MKVIGIIFIYNPQILEVINNIESYCNYLDSLIIWDNTPNQHVNIQKYFIDKRYYNKLLFEGGNGNDGLSIPINYAINYAEENKYDLLFTIDQDSKFINFQYYLDIISEQDYKNYIFVPGNKKMNNHELISEFNGWLINSGTVYGVNVIKKLGKVNESFFVEGIDTEYGIRARLNKIPILCVNGAIMQHQVFSDNTFHSILGIKIMKCKYNKFRLQGITFSIFTMIREFPIKIKIKLLIYLIKHYGVRLFVSILFFEEDRFELLKYYFNGICMAYKKNVIKYYS